MSFKSRLLALLPGHKSTCANDKAIESENEFGLHNLYDGSTSGPELLLASPLEDDQMCLEPVDVIAVHGLGGGAFSTWRHPKTRKIWLQDFLPTTMRASRVMTYGYDANIYKNRSTLHMMDNAENLLFEIQAVRSSERLQSRRIIFIGHSLGGILIKKALIMAREEEKYHNLLHSTTGIMFMGTPHDGADAAKLASTIANIANSITTLNTNNIKTLERDSVSLQEISRSFGFLKDLRIITVIESDKTRIPYINTHTLIVPQPSARLNLGDRETVLSIVGADHHMICKFSGEEDKQYQSKIKPALVTLAKPHSAGVPTLRYIPYSPDPGFAGRKGILEGLYRAFSVQDKHTRIALYGLGGIGKSGIAIEFAHKFLRSQPQLNIFWVRGASARRFEHSYRSIARGLRLDGHGDPGVNTLALVKEWMVETVTPWMMILDNADEESLYFGDLGATSDGPDLTSSPAGRAFHPLSDHIPQATNGCVLITSRDRKTALQLVGNQPENLIKIEELLPIESLNLIRTRISQSKRNDGELSQFAAMLGHIPLALTQACAYIEANELMTVSGYCGQFRESEDMEQRLLGRASYDLRRDSDMPNAVITTWQISFEYLKSQNPITASLLSFLGVLDRQHIPKFLAYVLDEDKLKVDEALNQLLAFCLVRTEASNEYLELHALVGTALHAWLKKHDSLSHWLSVAILVFSQLFPCDLYENVQQWPLCNLLLPHAQKSTYVAVCLDNQYQLEEAEKLHEQAIELAIAGWGPNDPRTLAYRCNLANTLQTQRRLSEAKLMFRHVWQCLECSAPHTSEWLRYHVSNHLARLLSDEGRLEEAEKMQEETYKAVVNLRGEDHEETLRIMNNLALALGHCGKSAQAEVMGRKVIEKQMKLLGPANIMTLYSMKNLASCLYGQEKFVEAREWIQRVADVEEDLFPVGHPDKLATAKCLAALFYRQKDYDSAEKVLRQAQSDGEAFPQNTYVLSNLRIELAQVLDAQGQFLEAEKIAMKVLGSRQPLSVSLDDSTCKTMQVLANILCHLLKEEEAENLQWQILEHYGDDERPNKEGLSRHGMSAFGAIARILKVDETLPLDGWCDEILKLQDIQRIGGSIIFQNRVRILSVVLAKLGCYTKGVELRARWRDKDDNTSLWLVNNLAEVYIGQNGHVEAKAILEPLVRDTQRIFGPRDKLTLSSMGFLAIALGSNTDEGARLLRTVIENAETNSKFALIAWHNLGIGYQRRFMDLEAFQTFQKANELALEHFEEDEPVAIQVRDTFTRFVNDHFSEGEAPGSIVFRMRVPLENEQAGSDRANVENDGAERHAVEVAEKDETKIG